MGMHECYSEANKLWEKIIVKGKEVAKELILRRI